MRRRHASTLSSQLLPLFGLDPAVYRLRFDFSGIEALRDDVDALHSRWRATYLAGGIDLYTFQEKIGLVPDEAYRGRYAKASASILGEGGDEVKGFWREIDHPRDEDGKFTSGGAGVVRAKLHREHGMGGGERTLQYEGRQKRLDLPAVSGLEYGDIGELVSYMPDSKSLNIPVDEAKKQLVAHSNDKQYLRLKKLVEDLTQEEKNLLFELNDPFRLEPLTQEEREDIESGLSKTQKDLALKTEELNLVQGVRYLKMWNILIANDHPAFGPDDFDIGEDFNNIERQKVNGGIAFLSKIVSKSLVPETTILKMRKRTIERSTYLLEGTDEGEANTILHGIGRDVDSVVHEMGHWLAIHNPQVAEQVKLFYERRTAGEKLQKLNDVTDESYEDGEVCKKDKFIDPYMGRYYRGIDYNEVLSVGLQYLFLAPDVLAKDDPDTFEFLYKLLRGQSPEKAAKADNKEGEIR